MDEGLRSELSKQGIFTTTLEELYNWGRKIPSGRLQFGLACCAIEMIATSMARFDLARFGAEVFRPSPRQADLMIVAGTVTKKMAPQVVRLYNQMPEPKYVIAMGACAISGGPFKQGYNVLKGSTGIFRWMSIFRAARRGPRRCIHAFMTLQKKIDEQKLDRPGPRRGIWTPDAPSEFPVPEFGEHDLEPPAIRGLATARGSPEANGTCCGNARNRSKARIEAAVPGRAAGDHSERQPVRAAFVCWIDEHAVAVAKFLRDDPELRLDYCFERHRRRLAGPGAQRKGKVKKVVDGVEKEVEETIEKKRARLSGSGLSSLLDGVEARPGDPSPAHAESDRQDTICLR